MSPLRAYITFSLNLSDCRFRLDSHTPIKVYIESIVRWWRNQEKKYLSFFLFFPPTLSLSPTLSMFLLHFLSLLFLSLSQVKHKAVNKK